LQFMKQLPGGLRQVGAMGMELLERALFVGINTDCENVDDFAQ
jgi:hypothetical protein